MNSILGILSSRALSKILAVALAAAAVIFTTEKLSAAGGLESVVLDAIDAEQNRAGVQLRAGSWLEQGVTFYVTIGAAGMSGGGQIAIRVPSSWTQPNINEGWSGQIVATTSVPGATLAVSIISTYTISVDISTSGASLSPGSVVAVHYRQPSVQWFAQDAVVFYTMTKSDASSDLTAVAVQPSADVVAGVPVFVTFETWGLTVKKGEASSVVRVVPKDSNWITTKATAPITVYLSGRGQGYYDPLTYMYVYPPDSSALFSATTNFASPITQITISSGSSGASFYYKTSTAPYSVVLISYTLNYPETQTLWVNVVSGGISNARLAGGALSDGGKTTTAGAEENIYINFDLGGASSGWQVYVSSSSDRTTALWTYWGWGLPAYNQVSWNGRFAYWDQSNMIWRDERAPNGTYYVRIRLGSGDGIVDDTLKIVVQSYEISGRVTEDGTSLGVAGVYVGAWGPSYSYATTDSSGYYKLGGLRAGSYYLDYSAPGFSRSFKTGVAANSSGVNVALKKPGFIRINARRAMSAQVDNSEIWGGVQITPAGGFGGGYWGSLHFSVGISTSDNGQWSSEQYKYEIDNSTLAWTAGKWTVVEVIPGTYTLRADLWGYVSIATNVYVGSGGRADTVLYFAPKKSAYGVIKLPAPSQESWGSWVSVEAVKSGDLWASAWGYTQIPVSESTGAYIVNGLDAGVYTIRTFAPGYRRASASVTVGALDDAVAVSTITLSSGGGLSGTVTVEGNTDDISLNLMGDPYDVYLNAWSPDAYSYGWTQVKLAKNLVTASSTFTIKGLDDGTYWINSWLNGFELDGAIGWSGVKTTVKDGSGAINLKFKRYSGRIKIAITAPENDFANVSVDISGPSLWVSGASMMSAYGMTFDTASVPGALILTSPPLGGGFYQIKARYNPTGYEKTKSIMAVNGQTHETSVDLSVPTYSISGTVRLSQSNPPAGYSSLDVLLDTAPAYNNFWINMYTSTTALFVSAQDYTKTESLPTYSATAQFVGYVNRSGTYTISGLVPGVYILKIPAAELDGNYGNGKETAKTEKRVIVTGNITECDLEISKGYVVSGQLRLPPNEYVTRDFYINVYDAKKFKVGMTGGDFITGFSVNFVNANSANYEIKGLPPGNYVLSVQDYGYWDNALNTWVPRQYANVSLAVQIESSDVSGRNINISRGGKIALKLRDADSGTVITPQNKSKMLPSAYTISAIANPWVDGGWSSLGTVSGTASDDKFTLEFLPEAVYDVMLGQSSYGMLATFSGDMSGNKTDYAAKTMTGINVKDNQITDLGLIDIRQGVTITGTVKDKSGVGIPNIPIVAAPSLTSEWSSELRGFTDINGKYSIVGLNPDNPYYDIVACPRIDPTLLGGYFFFGSGGLAYGEKTRSMVKISETSSVDFVLEEARGSVTGKVSTEDGGLLSNPSDTNLPTARIYMQSEETFPRTNPVGDIVADTDIQGNFAVEALAPGSYRLTILSAGYGSFSRTISVSSAPVNIGTLTLRRGAKISGSITKPDGKYPSTTEIKGLTAVSDDLSEFLVGTLTKSGDKAVAGYELYGFRKDSSYNIMFLTEGDEFVPARIGYTVPIDTYTKTDENLVFRLSAPAVLVRALRRGLVLTVNFDLTGSLRKSAPADDDLSAIVTKISGQGALGDLYMAPNRKSVSFKYTAPVGENKFSVRLKAFSKAVNPETGGEFSIDEAFEFHAGVSARNKVRVSNMRGGKITLEGDSSSVVFAPNAFSDTSSTSTLEVQFMKGDDAGELVNVREGRAAPSFIIPRAPEAYPARMHKAMTILKAAAINPMSSFYDVFLPKSVSRALKKDAKLSLQYSSAAATAAGDDPADYNVYYFDELNNVWLLENRDKSLDTANNTITVGVNHTSVFTVIKSNAPVIYGDTGVSELFVYNFPNPFSLEAKSIVLAKSSPANRAQNISGTMIHFGLPAGVAGAAEIRIYNVAGELVRTLKGAALGLDGLAANTHYYVEWDGKNDAGKPAASGIYIGRFTVGDQNERFFKMALIK